VPPFEFHVLQNVNSLPGIALRERIEQASISALPAILASAMIGGNENKTGRSIANL
jgi:hypothetical protein